jgi:hypothetical protein
MTAILHQSLLQRLLLLDKLHYLFLILFHLEMNYDILLLHHLQN